MLIRLSAAAALLAGMFFLSPFSLPDAAQPCTVAKLATDNSATLSGLVAQADQFDPPTASPIAGIDMHREVSSRYGMRTHPVMKRKQFHRGIDLRAKTGTPVLATADGEVYFAGEDGLYGIVVRIQHANGYRTVFAHLSAHQVEVGQRVKIGDVVAAVGTTGASTAPHLHYEVLKDDKPIDPLAQLK